MMGTGNPHEGFQEEIEKDSIQHLTRINLDDLVASFGLEDHPMLARMLCHTFARPARRFAAEMLAFDSDAGEVGLAKAARRILRKHIAQVRLFSAGLPPGPILALSNHPGMADTLALFSALGRPDLKIIAVDRPFLRSLPHTSRRMFFVKNDPAARMSLVRKVSSHLRSGGAALTFPAGQIEPDPNMTPGAMATLGGWTDSVGIFARMAPETTILPVLVRGVIWKKTADLVILRLKKTQEAREKLAAAFQLLAHLSLRKRFLDITVQVGRSITVKALGCRDTRTIHQAVLAEMSHLIENPPMGEGISLL